MWYWVFLKKNWPYVRLKWGLETSFGNPSQKSADTLNFAFTHVSCISQQKKWSPFPMWGRLRDWLIIILLLNILLFSFRQTMTLFEFVALKEIYGFINRIFFIGKACEPANKKQQIIYKITHHGKSSAFFSNIFNLKVQFIRN